MSSMTPDHYEILIEGTRLHVVRVRSLAGLRLSLTSSSRVLFWGRYREARMVFFPHRPELPQNPLEAR